VIQTPGRGATPCLAASFGASRGKHVFDPHHQANRGYVLSQLRRKAVRRGRASLEGCI
jgi:hypothetical protein